MPIHVQLEDERGAVLGLAGDFDRLVTNLDDGSVCWRFIDPYGDTVFNQLQMPDLLAELDRLYSQAEPGPERNGLVRLIELSRRCRDGIHLYVRFIGD